MASDKEEKKGWLEWLNDCASLIAAVIGILIAFQTMRINNEIDQLNENIEASSLISDLIGSLTAEDVKQDIALLALDSALTSDPKEDDAQRVNRHKKLVAEIAASLLNNQTLSVAEGEDGNALSRQIREEADTAWKILERLSQEPPGSEGPEEYQQIAQAALERYQTTVNSSKGPTGQVSARVNYQEVEGENIEDVVVPDVAVQNESELTPLQIEQQTLELATAAGAVSAVAEEEDSDRIIYLHYDDPLLETGIQALQDSLEEQDWFVIDNIELVRPTAFNCSVSSDIRFFHQDDEALARELREQISQESSADLKNSVEQIRLIDLSNWPQASLVPNQQLELWVIAKGDECRANRAQSNSPPPSPPAD
ncbi:MAG: hypothetical protein F6K42_08165 [Leptolyngbya sp. SIO1D8]|nr:hypothetical protein [Leptolyngbya sp. SIO1D8]